MNTADFAQQLGWGNDLPVDQHLRGFLGRKQNQSKAREDKLCVRLAVGHHDIGADDVDYSLFKDYLFEINGIARTHMQGFLLRGTWHCGVNEIDHRMSPQSG